MGGLSILTSVPVTTQLVCLLCASKGFHEVRADAWPLWEGEQGGWEPGCLGPFQFWGGKEGGLGARGEQGAQGGGEQGAWSPGAWFC